MSQETAASGFDELWENGLKDKAYNLVYEAYLDGRLHATKEIVDELKEENKQ